MSTYKNLIGKDVNFLTTDPDNEQAEGQIWYNSTSGVFKDVAGASTWSSTGSLTTARRESGWNWNSNSRFRFWRFDYYSKITWRNCKFRRI